MENEDQNEELHTWGPCSLIDAALIWAAGAGVAGAWYPEEMERLCMDSKSASIADLRDLHEQTKLRVLARFADDQSTIAPAGPTLVVAAPMTDCAAPWVYAIEWRTSVTLAIEQQHDQYLVALYGRHEMRRLEAQEAFERTVKEKI